MEEVDKGCYDLFCFSDVLVLQMFHSCFAFVIFCYQCSETVCWLSGMRVWKNKMHHFETAVWHFCVVSVVF